MPASPRPRSTASPAVRGGDGARRSDSGRARGSCRARHPDRARGGLDDRVRRVRGRASSVPAAPAMYTERSATAPWTRPANELVVGYGLFTAAEFALMARRHMLTVRDDARAAGHRGGRPIRNNGHVNPEAVYYGRGPFTADDILASRMVADPFHLLDCAMTSEGGCGSVLTTADRARDLPPTPVWILGGGRDTYGPAYPFPPVVGPARTQTATTPGRATSGRRAAARRLRRRRSEARRRRRARALRPVLVRDHPPARGVRLLRRGRGRRRSSRPATSARTAASRSRPTAARCRSATPALNAQMLQRVIRGVQQLRGTCATQQVPGRRSRAVQRTAAPARCSPT